jgi:hypothetical protein
MEWLFGDYPGLGDWKRMGKYNPDQRQLQNKLKRRRQRRDALKRNRKRNIGGQFR